MQQIAIVILNHNDKNLLSKFLPSIIQYSTFHQIIIVDNGSIDNSVAFIKQNYPTIPCIELFKNEGFARGYNLALRQVKANYYILLNADVAVTPRWIEPMLKLMEDNSQVSVCQPKILSYQYKNYFEYAGAAGGFIDKFGYPFCRGRIFDTIELDQQQYNNTQEVFWASGACLFIRASVFWELGGFDEQLFAYYEEIDLCWRIKRQGLKVYYCGQSTIYHVGSATVGKNNPYKTYLKFRNRALVLYKHMPKHILNWKHAVRCLLDLLAAFQAFTKGQTKHSWAILKAQIDFFKLKRAYHPPQQSYPINNIYQGLLPFDFFIKRKRRFSELDIQKFHPIIH